MTIDSISILKREVMAYWRIDPRNRPVKVVSLVPDVQPQATKRLEGYFTCYKCVSGRTPAEIRKILGLKDTDLVAGAQLYEATSAITEGDFDLEGSTHWYPGQEAVEKGYTLGRGVPQWTIRKGRDVSWRLVATVSPGEKFPS